MLSTVSETALLSDGQHVATRYCVSCEFDSIEELEAKIQYDPVESRGSSSSEEGTL